MTTHFKLLVPSTWPLRHFPAVSGEHRVPHDKRFVFGAMVWPAGFPKWQRSCGEYFQPGPGCGSACVTPAGTQSSPGLFGDIFDRGILDIQPHPDLTPWLYLTTTQRSWGHSIGRIFTVFSLSKKCNQWGQQPISAASAIFLCGFEKNGWTDGILGRLCLSHLFLPLFIEMRWIRSLENEVCLPTEQWDSAARPSLQTPAWKGTFRAQVNPEFVTIPSWSCWAYSAH